MADLTNAEIDRIAQAVAHAVVLAVLGLEIVPGPSNRVLYLLNPDTGERIAVPQNVASYEIRQRQAD